MTNNKWRFLTPTVFGSFVYIVENSTNRAVMMVLYMQQMLCWWQDVWRKLLQTRTLGNKNWKPTNRLQRSNVYPCFALPFTIKVQYTLSLDTGSISFNLRLLCSLSPNAYKIPLELWPFSMCSNIFSRYSLKRSTPYGRNGDVCSIGKYFKGLPDSSTRYDQT